MHRVFRIPYVTRVCAALEFLGVLHSLHHVLHNREYNCDMLNEWIDLSSGKKNESSGILQATPSKPLCHQVQCMRQSSASESQLRRYDMPGAFTTDASPDSSSFAEIYS